MMLSANFVWINLKEYIATSVIDLDMHGHYSGDSRLMLNISSVSTLCRQTLKMFGCITR